MQSASTLYFLVSLAGFVCVTNGQCDLSAYNRAVDIQSCSTNGGISMSLGETSTISNGTTCSVSCIGDGSARTMACIHDTWRFEPSECTGGSTGVVGREKRFFGFIFCWIFCGRSRPSPPPDRTPPHVFCPPDIHRFADPIQTSTRIHWDESVAYAVDNRDGRISAKRWSRKSPYYVFWSVTDVFYHASDRAGNNGYCKMRITVTTIRCSPGPNRYFRNGYYLCHPSSDFVYGTTCNYGCYYGYRIAGPKRRECLKSGRWSSAEPQCEVVTCPPLLPFPDGTFHCTDGSNFKSACSYICKPGYDVEPGTSRVRVCGFDGRWRGPVPVCTDSEPPKFTNCPRVLTYFTAKGSSKALVDWNIPSVTDNSRQTISPTQTSGISNTDYHPSGVYEIGYKAVDGAGNEARLCKFKVVVKELRCFPQYPLPYMRVDCPSGYRYGATCSFSCDSGYAINGSDTAVCERSNTNPPYTYWKMTTPTCEAQNTCPALTPPDNGALACDLWEDGSFCQMQCRNGTDIPPSFSSWKLFVCNIHGSWNFDGNIPPCSKIRNTKRTRMTVKIYYFDGSCPDVLNTIKQNFLSALQRSPFNSFLDSSKMTVENVKVTCGAVRERRSADTSDSHRVTTQADLVSTMSETQSKKAFKESEKQSFDLLKLMEDDIKGKNSNLFPHMKSDSKTGVESTEMNLDCPAGTLPSYGTVSCVSCTAGTYFASNQCEACPIGYYQPQQGQTDCLQCPQGKTTLREEATSVDKCFPMCQLGHFSASGVEPCTPCDLGQYADEMGARACKVCPVSMTTTQVGSTGLHSCSHFDISLTNVGTSYATLEVMADSVDLGTGFSLKLWVVINSENGGDIFTLQSSTDDLFSIHTDDQLQLIFSTSSSSALGFTLEKDTWYHIHLNYDSAILTVYVDGTKVFEKGRTETTWTARNSLLATIGGSGFEGSVSQINMWRDVQTPSVQPACFTDHVGDVLAWDNFTLSNLTEAFLQVPSECDDSDECLSGPCIHGDCTNVLNGYTCSCKEGYSGKDCDMNIDDCVAHRCINGGTCVDAVSNYTCMCTPEYTGEFCDANIVHGGWGQWGNWTECSKTCGPGERRRVRRCDNPVVQNGGASCSGPDEEVGTCNDSACPVCPEPAALPKGKLQCENQMGMRRCQLKCEEGYDLDREALDRYECGQETGYKWNYVTSDNPKERLPNCMEIQPASETEVRFGADYQDLKCDGDSANIQIIDNKVRQEANKVPCIRDNGCYIKDVIVNNNCDGSRQTRDIVLAHFTIVLANHPNITGIQSGLEALVTAVNQLNSSALSGVFTLTIGGVKYYLSSPVTSGHVTCQTGWTRVNFYCVPCGPGTYHTNGYCERCDIGFYNSVTGATSCHKCPTGKVTPGRGSHSVDECTVDVDIPSAIAVVAIVLGVLGPCLLITVIIVTFICIKWKKRKVKVQDQKPTLNNPCGPVIEAWGPVPAVSIINSSLPTDTRQHKMKLDSAYPTKVPVLGLEELDQDFTR